MPIHSARRSLSHLGGPSGLASRRGVRTRRSAIACLATWASLTLLAAPPAAAHTEANQAVPETIGAVRFGVAAAVSALSGSASLPSQGLPGYLLVGDPGIERRGTQLEHGVMQVGYRLSSTLSAQLALGAHNKDPIHVEAAWLQGQGKLGAIDWTIGGGRQRPSLGPVMTRAGHLDRFGLMPLAKQALTQGDWIDNGAQLTLRRSLAGIDWTLDAGIWAGRAFPGARPGAATPALHLGASWDGAGGEWSIDAFYAPLRPSDRGSRVLSTTGAHTHAAPVCDATLNQVVCFDGRSRLAGLSLKWEADSWPLTVSGAVMWRDERGELQSRNGLGRYEGRNRGAWIQAVWGLAPRWEVGGRLEQVMATQSLIGAGANLLATEAGLGSYAPAKRSAAMLSYALSPSTTVFIEAGHEQAGGRAARFVAIRGVVYWDRTFGPNVP